MRLVNKTICCIASKRFFQNVQVSFKNSDGSEALKRLEDISNSTWATDVRKLDIRFDPKFLQGMNRHSEEFHDLFNKIRLIFEKLPELNAFNFYPYTFGNRDEAFINMGVNTIRSLPLQNLTELEITHHYGGHYHGSRKFIPTGHYLEGPGDGLENLKHLGLKGHFTWEKDSELELAQLIRTAVNIESLRLQYHCSGVPNTLQFINPHRFRYLHLELGDIHETELSHILKKCKETIRYIEITADRYHGSHLQVLFQINRSLKLLYFFFRLRGDSRKIEELENGLRQDIRNEEILCVYAYSDIQRQIKANRLAAGLVPSWRRYTFVEFLETPPLESVMDAAHYQELCSLSEL